MSVPEDLYKPAIASGKLDALWDMRGGKTFFTGPLYYNAAHQHGAPVFLAGLYGNFRLRMQGGDWQHCRTAVIPAGVVHELDLAGDPVTVFYIEPSVAGAQALTQLMRHKQEDHGALIGAGGEFALLRELYEARYHPGWNLEPFDDLLQFAIHRTGALPADPRITQITAYMEAHGDDMLGVAKLAAMAGLSPSRFQHVFTQQIGVPFRSYRRWNRIRTAIREILKGRNFTEAAHHAGFTDSAHFSREHRKTFGAQPSVGLKHLARLQV